MTGVRWIVVLALAHSAAACEHWDRQKQTEAVYDAILLQLGRQIQVHTDVAGLSMAIEDHTAPEQMIPRSGMRRWGRSVLTVPMRAAIDDYLRRRASRAPIRGAFHVPHEFVSGRLSNSDLERLWAGGGIVELSAVGFDPLGRSAFVYVVHSCGFSECASGQFVFLSRTSGTWAVTNSSLAWIS